MGLGNQVFLLLFLFVCSFAPINAYSLTCTNLLFSHQLKVEKTDQKNLPLRFMSYNVLNLYLHKEKYVWTEDGLEKMNQDHLPKQKPEYQTKGLAKAIFQMDPDFLMLQEVEGARSLRRFNREYLGGEYRVFMPSANTQIGIAFLIRKNLDVQIEVENIIDRKWINAKGVEEKIFSRNLPIFKIFTKGSDKPRLIVAGAHFKAQIDRKGDPKSFYKRQAEVKASVKALSRLKKSHPDVPIMIMGDFNSSRGDNEMIPHFSDLDMFDAHLSEEHFVDVGGLGRATHTYHPLRKKVEQKAIETVTDRMLLTESLRKHLIKSGVYRYRKLDSADYKPLPRSFAERAENPSDHFPVYFDIEPSILFD